MTLNLQLSRKSPLVFFFLLPKGAGGPREAGDKAEEDNRVGPHPGVGHQAAGQARAVNSAPPGSQVFNFRHLNITILYTKNITIFSHIKVIRVALLDYLLNNESYH